MGTLYKILTTYPRFSKKGITSVLQDTKPTVHFPALLRPSTVSISLLPKPCLWNSGWTAMGPISIIPLWATALMHPRIYKKPKSSWVGIHKKRKPQCGASDVTWNWNYHFWLRYVLFIWPFQSISRKIWVAIMKFESCCLAKISSVDLNRDRFAVGTFLHNQSSQSHHSKTQKTGNHSVCNKITHFI